MPATWRSDSAMGVTSSIIPITRARLPSRTLRTVGPGHTTRSRYGSRRSPTTAEKSPQARSAALPGTATLTYLHSYRDVVAATGGGRELGMAFEGWSPEFPRLEPGFHDQGIETSASADATDHADRRRHAPCGFRSGDRTGRDGEDTKGGLARGSRPLGRGRVGRFPGSASRSLGRHCRCGAARVPIPCPCCFGSAGTTGVKHNQPDDG